MIDIPLNETGKIQAGEAAEKLKNIKIDYIICSHLKRAEETARIIQKKVGGEIIIDSELRERSYGKTEGMPYDEFDEKFPDHYSYEWRPEGGESYKDIEERVFNAFEKITNQYKGKNILIVSHGGALRTLLKRIRNLDASQMLARNSIKNAEVITLDHSSKKCNTCGKHLFEQDEDTLDTWFSSALWTFSTLGWPEKTKDLALYHPTDVLETGYDILFFWVARMILMTGYCLGTVPFRTIYLHGIIRDKQGRKMSKSLNNSIDPLEVSSKFGTDALRMALVVGSAPGTDIKIADDKIKGYKNFANKLWNISRFILESTADTKLDEKFSKWNDADKKLAGEKTALLADITSDMENFRFYIASEKIYHYAWHNFADIILEESKKIFKEGSAEEQNSRKQFLLHTLKEMLAVLHPFMPFITEEIWQTIGFSDTMLLIEKWPQ